MIDLKSGLKDSTKGMSPKSLAKGVVNYATTAVGLNAFDGQKQMEGISFAKKCMYDVKVMPNINYIPPTDFISYFPVIDLEFEEAHLDTFTREMFMSSYQIPLRTKAMTIKMTFYDNESQGLFNWFKNWINIDILNDGLFTSCIFDTHKRVRGVGSVRPVREFIITKLNNSREAQEVQIMGLFPVGTLSWAGSANSGEVQVYTMEFIIVTDGMKFPALGALTSGASIVDLGQNALSYL